MGDWFDSSNWCGGQVPICLGFVCISNGGTAQIVSTDPTAYACETFIGSDQCVSSCPSSAASGKLSVSGDTLNTCNELHVGYRGTGTLKITSGGVVNTTYGADIAGGGVATSNGAATVGGTNSAWNIGPCDESNNGLSVGGDAYGPGGTGLLTVTNGASVCAYSVHVYPSGTLTGNATVQGTNGTTIEGTIEPSGGTLTIVGNLTFSGGSSLMETNVVPASADNVHVQGGEARLTGILKVTMTGTSGWQSQYVLLHADNSLNQTRFQSVSITYPTDQGWYPKITYDADNVYLNVIWNLN